MCKGYDGEEDSTNPTPEGYNPTPEVR